MKALVDRSTLRALARTPGFTIMVIVSLALAVGLTTTTYGIVDAVMHPYVPYRAPEQLYAVQTDAFDVSDDLLADMARSLRAQRQLYSDFAIALAARAHPTIGVAGQTLDVFPQEASVNFFDVLGVRMFAGRGFRPEDRDAPDRAGVVVSYRFWRRYLHGATPLSSVPVMVDGQAYTVIGVLGARCAARRRVPRHAARHRRGMVLRRRARPQGAVRRDRSAADRGPPPGCAPT